MRTKKQIIIRVDPELHSKIKQLAKSKNVSVYHMCSDLIERWANRQNLTTGK